MGLNYEFRESPLYRLSTLFNVNHFIISQARPFVVPLLFKSMHCPGDLPCRKRSWFPDLLQLLRLEIRHRLVQVDSYGLIPNVLYRLLLDEDYPNLTLLVLPRLSLSDYLKSFWNPTRESLQRWILRGERGTWPAMSSIKVRTILEVELEKGYQIYQRKQDNSIYDPYS
jgi:TAG lipase/lysophosphatidylethanolamine acyltransferase